MLIRDQAVMGVRTIGDKPYDCERARGLFDEMHGRSDALAAISS